MSVILDLDPSAQQTLEEAFGKNLGRSAFEALVTEGYRLGKLSRSQVQRLLALPNRFSAEAWLKEHDAAPAMSVDDVLEDAEQSRRSRNRK